MTNKTARSPGTAIPDPSDRSTDRVNLAPPKTPALAVSTSFSSFDSLASGETPTPPSAAASARAPRMGKLRADLIRSGLTTRDHDILTSLSQHRFLTSRQLERWHFHTLSAATRTCLRVLGRLRDDGLITTLERRLGGHRAGSSGYSWHLTQSGNTLLAQHGTRGRRIRDPSLAFLHHELGIAETHLQLIEAARKGSIDLIDVTTEPACWRTYLGGGGQTLTLKPDLFAVTAHGTAETLFFIEYDRGSESLPTLIRKAQVYESYYATGLEQRRSGAYPFVLWIMPDAKRKEKLIRALGSTAIRHTDLHLVATYNDATDTVVATSQEEGDQ